MEIFIEIVTGFETLFRLDTFIIMFLASVIGLLGGVIPGVGGTVLVVLFIPVTYAFEPTQAFVLLTVLYVTSVYGGMVTAILFRAPGTPESAMTVLDGYPMAQQGQAGRALGVGLLSSGVGAIISSVVLLLLTPLIASVAVNFAAPEFFALAVLGLSVVAALSSGQLVKGVFGAGLGMLIATVGSDPMTGFARFSFGVPDLASGLGAVPVLIGLFAIPEIMRKSRGNTNERFTADYKKITMFDRDTLRAVGPTIGRSGLIGTFIGILPGAGAATAAILGYSQAVKFSKDRESFGKGNPKGVAGVEAANNAGAVGALVPLFALGIPGSATAAVLIGAFVLHGLQPGPNLMNDQSLLVYTVIAAVVVANVLVLLIAKPFVRTVIRIINVPYHVLGPGILILSVLGAYSLRNSLFDVGVMLAFGIVGYLLDSWKFPVAPVVLGFILGPIAEDGFRRSLLLSDGSYAIFLTRPVTFSLLAIAVGFLVYPAALKGLQLLRRKKSHEESTESADQRV